MKRYFSFDQEEMDFGFWDTPEQAKAAAERSLQSYRDYAPEEGWPENEETCAVWGEIKEWPHRSNFEKRIDYEAHGEEWPYSDGFDEVYQLTLRGDDDAPTDR